jgi:SAM-dependent methyltransferase
MTDRSLGAKYRCRICDAEDSISVASVSGRLGPRRFELRRCNACRFVFVSDPWLDYDAIYSEAYYRGEGADTKLNYVEEVQHPTRTIRRYEWRGITERVGALTKISPDTAWLDYGCGTGGLVSFLRGRGIQAVGFEQGWCVPQLHEQGVPTIDEPAIGEHAGRFDIVTAIEVIEHTIDPVGVLRQIRSLLKPGGLLFLTTANAAPFADRLASWRYMTPEVHISFFEPATLALALEKAGFEAGFPGYGPGWQDIIRYKVLMSLHRKWTSPVQRAAPWGLLAKALDSRLRLSAQPIGWARDEGDAACVEPASASTRSVAQR